MTHYCTLHCGFSRSCCCSVRRLTWFSRNITLKILTFLPDCFFFPGTRCGPRCLSLNEFPSCKWMGGPVKTSLTVVLVARKYFNTYWGFAESLLVKTVQIQWINVFMSLGFGPDCLHPSYSKLKSVQMFHQWLWCYFSLKTSFCWHNFSFFQHFHCLGCWAYIC